MSAAKRLKTDHENKKQRVMEEHDCADYHLTVEQLNDFDIVSNIKCPEPNCERQFDNKSALSTHLDKVHRSGPGDSFAKKSQSEFKTIAFTSDEKLKNGCVCKYYCPIEGCRYSQKSRGKHLPSFFSLKHHYIRNHKKSYACGNQGCPMTFGIKSDLVAHLKSCGMRWYCQCGQAYQSKQALKKHVTTKSSRLEPGHGELDSTITLQTFHNEEPTEDDPTDLFWPSSDEIDLIMDLDFEPSIDHLSKLEIDSQSPLLYTELDDIDFPPQLAATGTANYSFSSSSECFSSLGLNSPSPGPPSALSSSETEFFFGYYSPFEQMDD